LRLERPGAGRIAPFGIVLEQARGDSETLGRELRFVMVAEEGNCLSNRAHQQSSGGNKRAVKRAYLVVMISVMRRRFSL